MLSPIMNGGGQVHVPPQQANPPRAPSRRHSAKVRVIEPLSKEFRFRYECEGKTAGSISGAHSKGKTKTFPEIQVEGYKGEAVLQISCVTKDPPYKVHPHNVVGKSCKDGVCRVKIPPDTMRVKIQSVGIQSTKKQDVKKSLEKRESIRVDPFNQGYAHKNDVKSIDINNVRLCFQVFLKDEYGNFSISLSPVVSDVIQDTKSKPDLTITRLSDCVSPVDGGKHVILLCGKVVKGDVEVHFYEEEDQGNRIWQREVDIQHSQIHKTCAIWFFTPPYKILNILDPAKVFIQLYQPSDGSVGAPVPFQFIPSNTASENGTPTRRKKAKFDQIKSTFGELLARDEHNIIQNIMDMPLFESPETKSIPRDLTSTFAATSLNDRVTCRNISQTNTQYPNVFSPNNLQPMRVDNFKTTLDSNFPTYLNNRVPMTSTSTSSYPGSTYQTSPHYQNISSPEESPPSIWNIPANSEQPLQLSMDSGELQDLIQHFNIPNELPDLNPLCLQPSSEPPPQLLDLDSHQMNLGELQLHTTRLIPNMDEPDLNYSSFGDFGL